MANTVKNGKGPEIRKGANLKAYWEAEIWNKMGKRKINEPEQTTDTSQQSE